MNVTSHFLPCWVHRLRHWRKCFGLPLLALLLFGCQEETPPSASGYQVLDQGWNDEQRERFYFTSQGSRLIDYALFIHLEQAGQSSLFRDPAHLRRLGYVPMPASARNPAALPVGFVRDGTALGLTCAACHTRLLQVNGQSLLIDGGQGMGDLHGLIRGLRDALQATLNEPVKFHRLAARFGIPDNDSDAHGELRLRLQTALADQHRYLRRNAVPSPPGFGRVDALGHIFNKALRLTGVEQQHVANAPVSYPVLWDTPHHDWVQWNGSASNKGLGPLARNVGQVFGVFAEVEPQPPAAVAGLPSSVNVGHLQRLEAQLHSLTSPRWPPLLPAIDSALAAQGRALYDQYCLRCHQRIDPTDDSRQVRAQMTSLAVVGTDPTMARNAALAQGRSGRYATRRQLFVAGPVLGQQTATLRLVQSNVWGILFQHIPGQVGALLGDESEGHPLYQTKWLDGQPISAQQLQNPQQLARSLLAYKARPLNGIWASAPYLHNGSVPTLYELLLPAEQRPETFWLSSEGFDPVAVGVAQGPRAEGFFFDTRLPGNGNQGHEFGTGKDAMPALSDQQRWALVEYLKTL